MEKLDVAVIGAGVIGLAVARQLALSGREVVILERQDAFGTETSSRNSEVIHAGIYYPTGSLKARFCVAGRRALYDYCRNHGVAHARCGKLIAAVTAEEETGLAALKARAEANGVTSLRHLTGAQARALEPELNCAAALLSPETGIVDSHGLMLAYLGDGEDHGAAIAYNSPVERGKIREDGIELAVGGPASLRLLCKTVINCAGLWATETAAALDGFPREKVPPLYYAKGSYFSYQGKNPFSHLIYPMPPKGFLGVHGTMDLAGQLRFGPDLEWVDHLDYDVDPARGAGIYGSVRQYWPGLPDDSLIPAYAGIRPKLHGPHQGAGVGRKQKGSADFADFQIQDARDHGCPGLVNLFGIESPGLTSSLAIAEAVAERLGL